MNKLLANKRLSLLLYFVGVILSIGMGMGVPILSIFFGFLVGWLLPVYLKLPGEISRIPVRRLIKASLLSCVVPLVVLSAIWLPALSWLADPARDVAQFGMPLILFEPLASFIGWLLLMVLISPFLQFLMTLLGGVVRMAYIWGGDENQPG